ncbi:uncharacterized protein LOC113751871 isoform X1 [Coffea eugenioides]|uniref:uncharacterized protein LOC113751871 isoform X1 n=1 Tax=Coffea eugenioides TaxID=49369 RepID=UPI000F607C06|nr:uncharacterized protein LOC113751871 isoform X1 [Coffea eugenioides]
MDVDIDVDIARWILEFLVRQPLDDRIVSSLISILPPTNENSGLKKSLLLRRIESEISAGSVSEKILDILEQIEELDFQDKIKQHSDLIKAAYCSVAVACTAKFLNDKDVDSKFRYFDAVRRIWRGRVCKMENAEKVGLISEELKSWKDELEAAVWDESIWDSVLQKSKGLDAVGAVRLYVREEKDDIGPSFLELVAEALRADDKLKGILGFKGTHGGAIQSSGPRDANRGGCFSIHVEVQRANVVSGRKHVASKGIRGAPSGMSRGAKIIDGDTSGADISGKTFDLPSTPEVHEVQEALKSSSLDLKAVVKDPLPDALNIADTVVSSIERKDAGKQPVEENHVGANPSIAESSGAVQANEGTLGNHCSEHQKDAPRQSLMARSSTARTFEWDDSVDALAGDSPNPGNGVQLPSPKRRVVSPLKKYEINNMKKRRKFKRWSTSEEETLRIGVEKYGRGNWKVILNAYRDVFDERTEVDLKDKWRNLTR